MLFGDKLCGFKFAKWLELGSYFGISSILDLSAHKQSSDILILRWLWYFYLFDLFQYFVGYWVVYSVEPVSDLVINGAATLFERLQILLRYVRVSIWALFSSGTFAVDIEGADVRGVPFV